jgi:hypothetical protein
MEIQRQLKKKNLSSLSHTNGKKRYVREQKKSNGNTSLIFLLTLAPRGQLRTLGFWHGIKTPSPPFLPLILALTSRGQLRRLGSWLGIGRPRPRLHLCLCTWRRFLEPFTFLKNSRTTYQQNVQNMKIFIYLPYAVYVFSFFFFNNLLVIILKRLRI